MTTNEVQQAVLGSAPGYCRGISPDRAFSCDQPVGHDSDHRGFEMPTVVIAEGEER